MNKLIPTLFLAGLLLGFSGCKTWHTLEFDTESQPIQFGPHHSTSGTDTLGIISGYFKQHSEDAVYSESDNANLSVTMGGDEYLEENLSATIYQALEDHPDHFIADGLVEVKVKRGVTFWSFLRTMIAGAITGGESEGGEYSTEKIHYTGVVYTISEENTEGSDDN
jgi:hypothetical protein